MCLKVDYQLTATWFKIFFCVNILSDHFSLPTWTPRFRFRDTDVSFICFQWKIDDFEGNTHLNCIRTEAHRPD